VHSKLRTIRILYRAPDSLDLWGIPYLMREGQEPRHLLQRQKEGSLRGSDEWIWLGTPGWFAGYEKHQIAEIKAFLQTFKDFVPGSPHEWAVLPPIEVVDAALGKREPELLRPGHHKVIKWIKFPGGAAKIAVVGGPYAKSEDGRFMVYVRRYLQGEPGNRTYSYHFSGVDYGIPSKGARFTEIPIIQGGLNTEYASNPKKVMASVEKWAAEHHV